MDCHGDYKQSTTFSIILVKIILESWSYLKFILVSTFISMYLIARYDEILSPFFGRYRISTASALP